METGLLLGGLSFHDQHRDMRLDIDNMSYEVRLYIFETHVLFWDVVSLPFCLFFWLNTGTISSRREDWYSKHCFDRRSNIKVLENKYLSDETFELWVYHQKS